MNRKPSLLVVFLTVFIDLIGFGIVVPLVPIFSRHYGASGWVIGAIIASFSAMQFVFSPIWGRLSDRHGRRPILLISTAGAALSYVLFAVGSGFENHTAALWTLLVSRVFAGICGGNITVAQAYIADITPPENRSKRMGLIGMAFGLGFIFGPIIGGVSLAGFTLGGIFGLPKIVFNGFGPTGPGWAAVTLCVTNFIMAYFILAESLKPDSSKATRRPYFAQWGHTLAQPNIGLLILIFFLATFAFSCFESTLPLLVSDNFNLGITVDETKPATTVISLFVFCGIIGAVIQWRAIGPLVKMFGEPKLISLSLFLTGISLILLPFIKGDGQAQVAGHPARDGLAVDQNASGAGAAGGGLRPDAPAAFRIVVQPRARERTGRDHRRGAKRGKLGPHFRSAVRRDALYARRIAALRHLRSHFHSCWCVGDAAVGQKVGAQTIHGFAVLGFIS